MRTLSQVLDGSSLLTHGGENSDTANSPQHGLTPIAGRTNTLTLPPVEDEPPHQRAQRATNAASWLASPELLAVKTGRDYAVRDGEFVAVGLVVNVDPSLIPPNAFERVLKLLHPATFEEIVYHLNRLALHRRKSGIGEATLPAFIEDVAGDLRRLGVTTLGIAVTAMTLRTNAADQWFPQWEEIEKVAASVESSLRVFTKPDSAEKLLVKRDERRFRNRDKWDKADWQGFVNDAASMARMWNGMGEVEKAREWVETVRGRIMEFDSVARGFKIDEPEEAKWVL